MKKIAVSILLISLFLSPFFYNFTTDALLSANAEITTRGVIVYGNPAVAPSIGGWGGVLLSDTESYKQETNGSPRTSPTSIAFPGEVASDAEMEMIYMKNHGYNTVRAYFEPFREGTDREGWGYNSTWMSRMISIAQAFDMYVIMDCHGYAEAHNNNTLWINLWKDIITQFKDSYSKIIWEPINEPQILNITGTEAVSTLGVIFQDWINQARSLGDTHWTIVSGLCWGNGVPNMVDWFPVVTDSLNKVFYNFHFYYFYDFNSGHWTVVDAQTQANNDFNVITQVISKYNRPFICTEMGAQSYLSTPPPDLRYDGASGYSTVSLAYIQELVKNFDVYQSTTQTRIGYMLFPTGSWAKDWSEGENYAGLYGGMNVWGNLLSYDPFPTP